MHNEQLRDNIGGYPLKTRREFRLFQLSEKQAQEIVDKMMMDIPYNINIMNDQGIIIGSGHKARVGTVHQGAVEALSTGHRVEVMEDGRYEKKAPTNRLS